MLYIVPGHYPEILGRWCFLKIEKKSISRSLLNELATHAPTQVESMRHCVGPGNVNPSWLLGAKPQKLQES